MHDEDFDADAWIEAMAPVLGLTIAPEQRAGVRTFLDLARGMARLLETVELPDDALDLAPVFTPDGPA